MIECSAARAALLDADLDELRGIGDTPLAAHVRVCPACQRSAARILAATARTSDALSAAVEARATRQPLPRARRARALRFVLPLAAAAVIAVVVIGERRAAPESIATSAPRAARTPSAGVNASADGVVAVMETANPAITVVWIF